MYQSKIISNDDEENAAEADRSDRPQAEKAKH